MLTAVAAFAEVFTHPATLGLVLALALLIQRPARLRLAAALVGAGLSLPAILEASRILVGVAVLSGGVAAALLQAEVLLHLVLPGCRFAWRVAQAAWKLLLALLGALFPRAPVRTRPAVPLTCRRSSRSREHRHRSLDHPGAVRPQRRSRHVGTGAGLVAARPPGAAREAGQPRGARGGGAGRRPDQLPINGPGRHHAGRDPRRRFQRRHARPDISPRSCATPVSLRRPPTRWRSAASSLGSPTSR